MHAAVRRALLKGQLAVREVIGAVAAHDGRDRRQLGADVGARRDVAPPAPPARRGRRRRARSPARARCATGPASPSPTSARRCTCTRSPTTWCASPGARGASPATSRRATRRSQPPTEVAVDASRPGTASLADAASARRRRRRRGARSSTRSGRRRYVERTPLARGIAPGAAPRASRRRAAVRARRAGWRPRPHRVVVPAVEPRPRRLVGLRPEPPVQRDPDHRRAAPDRTGVGVPREPLRGRRRRRTRRRTPPHGVTVDVHDGALVTYVAIGELDARAHDGRRPPRAPRRCRRAGRSATTTARWGWRTDGVVGDVLDGFVARAHPRLGAAPRHRPHGRVPRLHLRPGALRRRRRPRRACEGRAARGSSRSWTPRCGATRGSTLYREGVDGDHFVSDDRRARRARHGVAGLGRVPRLHPRGDAGVVGVQVRDAHLESASTGVWHDMNEPTSITLWGDRTLPRAAVHDLDGRGARARRGAQPLRPVHGPRRPRGAAQRTGDGRSCCRGPAGRRCRGGRGTGRPTSRARSRASPSRSRRSSGSASRRCPFTGSDLGGFTGIPSPGLYVRWLELGVVSPFCRTHCVLGAPDREPWRFPAPFDAGDRAARAPSLPAAAAPVPARRRGAPPGPPRCCARRTGRSAACGSWWDADATTFLLGDELLVVPVADPDAKTAEFEVPPGGWRRLRLCAPLDGDLAPEDDVDGRGIADPRRPARPAARPAARRHDRRPRRRVARRRDHARRRRTPRSAGRSTSTSTTRGDGAGAAASRTRATATDRRDDDVYAASTTGRTRRASRGPRRGASTGADRSASSCTALGCRPRRPTAARSTTERGPRRHHGPPRRGVRAPGAAPRLTATAAPRA